MADILAVAMLAAFFALAVLFVRACERIIGPDSGMDAPADTSEPERATA